ncbi:hypothetical protein PAHAL_9G302700 [Panicum hallii]|uniref:Uncharacterized protein n=1 Tax=Panicum hallii TaxID=206008 RepID=A0A2T8I302_9POAL|nr:hypothetical protein PAHAL_9G302700 [Panicum hallii]
MVKGARSKSRHLQQDREPEQELDSWEDVCFICRVGGHLMLCDFRFISLRSSGGKAYIFVFLIIFHG